MKYTGYIYIIENIINNLKYVGKTDNLRRRWNEHIRLNHSSCTALIRAMKKYGVTCEKIRHPIKECHSRNRKITQYDINNNLIKIYTSKSKILNTLKIKKSALKMCLCGKNKTSGGFIWKYIIERREFNEKL